MSEQDNQEDLSKQAERERHKELLRKEAITQLMATQGGRLFVYGILEMCGLYHSSAGVANFRTNETFFHEGMRNAGLRIQSQILDVAPGSYSIMLNESNEEYSDD